MVQRSVFLVFLTLLAISCQKSDEEISEALIGTWVVARCNAFVTEDEFENTNYWFASSPIQFNSDGSVFYGGFCVSHCGTYLGSVPLCTCSYGVLDGSLTVTSDDTSHLPYSVTVEIDKISGSKMQIAAGTNGTYKAKCSCFKRIH